MKLPWVAPRVTETVQLILLPLGRSELGMTESDIEEIFELMAGVIERRNRVREAKAR